MKTQLLISGFKYEYLRMYVACMGEERGVIGSCWGNGREGTTGKT